MKHSQLNTLANYVFGPHLAATYLNETVIDELGFRTCSQALADGEKVKTVWEALCDFYEVPEAKRWEIPDTKQKR